MKTLLHVLGVLFKLAFAAAAVLAAVYFLNLDQLLLDGLYAVSRRLRGEADGGAAYGAL